jgi:hypothetical protein
MSRLLLFRTGIILILVSFAMTSFAQDRSDAATENKASLPQKTTIVYTGKLLGYFRVPSLQKLNAPIGCPYPSPDDDSRAAIDFLANRRSNLKDAILVGTGDNFSPQLEARVFDVPYQSGKYFVANKELYMSDGQTWTPYDQVKSGSPLDIKIKNGHGTIPTDNVGCFLRAARYNAIVPGKHDFYFGPERVRELARFLARTDIEKDAGAVQMLGANLVLKTAPIKDQPIPPALKEKPWFEVDWSKDYPARNIKDGSSVYPWLSYVKIQLAKLPGKEPRETLIAKIAEFQKHSREIKTGDVQQIVNDAKAALPQVGPYYDQKQRTIDEKELEDIKTSNSKFPNEFRICLSKGNPNEIPTDVAKDCQALSISNADLRITDDALVYYFPLEPLQPNNKLMATSPIGPGKLIAATGKPHYSTLEIGKNYALCDTGKSKTNCLRFSVYTPFFYFPHRLPQESTDSYTDPDPYVIIDDRAAVFGVVDPELSSQVGILNFGWQNDAENLTSRVSAEDPADALRQQLEYFERQHHDFKGLKILLAQISPQHAKKLAAKFPEFQIVVSEADLEQGTSEAEMQTTWRQNGKPGSFLAVPTPYFDSQTRKGTVHFGMIDAEKKDEASNSEKDKASDAEEKKKTSEIEFWTLVARSLPPRPVVEKEDPANAFWQRIEQLPKCLPEAPKPSASTPKQEYLKLLVLCAMRDHLSADVALIQERDLYDKLPSIDPEITEPRTGKTVQRMLSRSTGTPGAATPTNIQQMLDRLVWKGDLITLLYVPGSALKAALDQSDKFEAEETATLSVVGDRGRKLETLGITKDSVTEEYLINEVPLDEKKIYAVATTDFIGAGDTGYPDLAKAALNPRTHPAGFPNQLISISSLVCRKYFDNDRDKIKLNCLGPIDRSEYLDKTVAAQIEPQRQPSAFRRFLEALPFKAPGKDSPPGSPAEELEQRVQHRGIWLFSLKDLSFGFDTLNNNFTDKEIGKKFGGNPTSGVQATENKTYRVGLDVRASHSSHRREFYIEPGIDYKKQKTGDTPETFQISQISNRVFTDAGFVFWRLPGRAMPNVGANISLHVETQLQNPFSTFTLSNDAEDVIKIYQGRSMTLLPRVGLRWQNRENFTEFGIQGGKEFNALLGYQFDTLGGPVECLANSAETFATCISNNSKTPQGITKDTPVNAVLQDRPKAGMYWKSNFTIPFTLFGAKLKYVFDDEADFLFVNFHQDTSIDTRFRDISKHTLSISLWPSVSIGPTLRLLLYQNKVNRDFLIQREFGIETTVSFDLFNRREKWVQLKNKP